MFQILYALERIRLFELFPFYNPFVFGGFTTKILFRQYFLADGIFWNGESNVGANEAKGETMTSSDCQPKARRRRGNAPSLSPHQHGGGNLSTRACLVPWAEITGGFLERRGKWVTVYVAGERG